MGVSSFDIVKANGFIGPLSTPLPLDVVSPGAKTYYVCNATTGLAEGARGGSNGNSGTSPLEPFSTIDYAIGRCTANRGDVIYVLPGHVEDITTAAAIVLDIAGVSIIGCGRGSNRPTITCSGTTDTLDIDVDAANCRLSNFIIDMTGNDGVDAFIDVNAADFTLDSCLIVAADSGGQVDKCVVLETAADRFTFINNRVDGTTAGPVAAIDIVGTPTGVTIQNNWIYGDYSTAAIMNATGNIATHVNISNNQIHNVNAADWCIELVSACTGIISNNVLGSDAVDTALDPGSCICSGNTWMNTTVPANGDPISLPIPTTSVTGWNIARANYNFTADAGAQGALTLFTVSGDVVCSVIGVCNTALTGATATIEVGVSGNTAVLIAQATGTDLIANEIYHDASPTTTVEAVELFGGAKTFIITNGQDIIFTIGTADLTAGDVDFYCAWRPLSPDAYIVAAR